MAAAIWSYAACCAAFSLCRTRTGPAGIAMVSGWSVTSPLRASDRAAGLAFRTVPSRSFRLCDPG